MQLFNSKDLNTIGSLANHVKQSRFGNNAYFNVNVHVNQTNICTLACKFCAFRRGRRAADAYQLEIDEYIEDLRKYSNFVDEVHSVGGLHQNGMYSITLNYSEGKQEFPHIHIKALTAVEIKHASLSKISHDTLKTLMESGLGSLRVVEQKYWMMTFERLYAEKRIVSRVLGYSQNCSLARYSNKLYHVVWHY